MDPRDMDYWTKIEEGLISRDERWVIRNSDTIPGLPMELVDMRTGKVALRSGFRDRLMRAAWQEEVHEDLFRRIRESKEERR